jgi:hypothetical protein
VITFNTLRRTCPALWFAVYALGLLCVLSFIAFEVLDLDGSDFQTDPRRASFKPAESEHYDIRRVGLTPTSVFVGLVVAAADDALVRDDRLAVTSSRPLPSPTWRSARRLLARGSLGDVPPAA